MVIKDNQTLRIKPNAIDSAKIKWHSIESEDISTSAITSRIIEDKTIQGEDIDNNAHLTIGKLTMQGYILPSNDNKYSLGSAAYRFKDLYLGPNSLHIIGDNGEENSISYDSDQDYFALSSDTQISGDLTVTGIINGSLAGSFSPTGNVNMATHILTNIGNSGTDFTATGGLTLAGSLVVNNTIQGTTLNTGQGNYELYAMNQDVLTTSSPTFAGLTLNGNLILGSHALTTTNTDLISNLNADLLDGQQGAYYLNTATNFSGDLTGTYNTISITDDSHSHTATTLPATTSYLGQTIETLEVTDSTLTTTDFNPALSLLTGQTLTYGLGTLTANALNTALTYGVNISGNSATVTNGLYSTGTYNDPDWLNQLSGLKITSNISTNAANVTGTVSISNGGTGQTTAQAARNALLPTQTSNAGKFLQTDGTDMAWQNVLWSQLGAPSANLSLAMQSYTTTFTYGNATGASNLFTLADTASNTGTGILLNISTGDSSLLNPFRVSASNGIPAIAVDSTGKVGIGWTDPTSQLTVIGGATFGATYSVELLNDGYVAIENGLGIGTTNPVKGKMEIVQSANTNAGGLAVVNSGGTGNLRIWIDADDNARLDNQATAAGNILLNGSGTGNVGIGTTNPQSELEVNGSISQTCPTGYVWVPGSAKFGTRPGFCAMKYEAKCDDDDDGEGDTTAQDGTYKTWHNNSSACTSVNSRDVVSSAAGAPIAYISQETAREYCQNLGTGYHLISDQEWMTIAENITDSAINDMDDAAGWQFGGGHNDNTPSNALASTAAADPIVSGCDIGKTMEDADNAYAADCEIQGDGSYSGDDNDKGYYGTSNQWAVDGYTAGASNKSQLRTHILSNKNVIWDIPGNVWEWTDALVIGNEEPDTSDGWKEYNTITSYKALNYIRPHDDGLSSANGIGKLYSYVVGGSTNTYAFGRGGNWGITTNAGLFALGLGGTPTNTNGTIGFRCVFAP